MSRLRTDLNARLAFAKELMVRCRWPAEYALKEARAFLDVAQGCYEQEDKEKAERADREELLKRRRSGMRAKLTKLDPGENIAKAARRLYDESRAAVEAMSIEDVRKELDG